MLYNILNTKNVQLLDVKAQKSINGGSLAECPTFFPLGCFSGPFYCNTQGLPICPPVDEEA
ncbi:hypothetical protein [Tenacibaculum amylolyticum]|uniref:hypothetical protein n=1 Tax=Tenacibaculum amylolyticum TaxID=104269 RepID=UPI00389592A2